jgi:hypothetical protein
MKLTPVQKTTIAKWMTVTNLGGGFGADASRPPAEGVKDFVLRLYNRTADDHASEGLDIADERRFFDKEMGKPARAAYWAGKFEEDFGKGSVAAIV